MTGILRLFGVLCILLFVSCGRQKENRLAQAASPYLREHADNPVDWYEWGDEALQLAKKQNKPLLISVGYASCHWCHEMERESFMDTAVARLMNENFICIKVDSEERPDINNIYMSACELVSGNSGWPLNAFALPDGKPFYAGTYFPKQSWMNLLRQVSTAYKTQPGKVRLQAGSLANGVAKLEFSVLTDSASGLIDKAAYNAIVDSLYPRMDFVYGGLKGVPKFPQPSLIDFLLQYNFYSRNSQVLDLANTTLQKMAQGGIYDQIGGGFARYSTDSIWRVPHFEKMLYDNAQLMTVYAHAYQVTGNEYYKQILSEIFDFLERDLGTGSGGYFSSINADTKDGEGAFYSWSSNDLKQVLKSDFAELATYFHVSEKGNWKPGQNLLYTSETPVQFSKSRNTDSAAFMSRLLRAKNALLAERNKRVKPTVDGKMLTSWNALAVTGLVDAYTATGDEKYLRSALKAGRAIEQKVLGKNGRLSRNYSGEKNIGAAFLDDYAYLGNAYAQLYKVTFDKHWLLLAKQLADFSIVNFYDPAQRMFFYSAKDSDSRLIRKIEISDNARPASNASMAKLLYRLSVCFEDSSYRNISSSMLMRMRKELSGDQVQFYGSWCEVAGYFAYGTNEVAISGEGALAKSLIMQRRYLPASIFIGSSGEENLPLLQGRGRSGDAMIYVCTKGTCKRPVNAPEEALLQLLTGR